MSFSPCPSPNSFLSQNREDKLVFLGPNSGVGQSPEFYLINETTLKGVSSPVVFVPRVLGNIVDDLGEATFESRKEILEYTVQQGDTFNSIAENFGVSVDTILWANNLSKKSKITVGQKLIILPVSGVLYEVKSGDSLARIAKKYKGEISEIISFNNLAGEEDIFAGDILVIPNGTMPVVEKYVPDTSNFAPLASSYFICPISSPCRITQGLHFPNAVDMSHGKCGEPIFAAAGGEVTRVRYGYNNGAGNYIRILHPNGVATTYGHILTSFVNPGDKVSQGEIIALMGGQPGTAGAGRSTGCHLHFSVTGARNPFAE
jgi:LysM repeat protein